MFRKKRIYDRKKTETRKESENRKNSGFFEYGSRGGCEYLLCRSTGKGMRCAALLKRGVTLLVLALAINIFVWNGQRMLLQRGIADEVLRFHVLANSDSE